MRTRVLQDDTGGHQEQVLRQVESPQGLLQGAPSPPAQPKLSDAGLLGCGIAHLMVAAGC